MKQQSKTKQQITQKIINVKYSKQIEKKNNHVIISTE